jgi:hypothetical protein
MALMSANLEFCPATVDITDGMELKAQRLFSHGGIIFRPINQFI